MESGVNPALSVGLTRWAEVHAGCCSWAAVTKSPAGECDRPVSPGDSAEMLPSADFSPCDSDLSTLLRMENTQIPLFPRGKGR